MDIMGILDDCIAFGKEKLDALAEFWDSIDEGRKKLLIGCAVATVAVVTIASIAYAIGKSNGRRLAYDEEDF